MIKYDIQLDGTRPLLMHNIRALGDPLHPVAKAIKRVSAKRKKTEEDHLEMRKLEFFGGLYMDDEEGPYVPAVHFMRCLVDAARITREGKNVERGVIVLNDIGRLEYGGPRTAEGLWEDESFRSIEMVRVGQARVARCRPMFRNWSTSFEAQVDTAIMSPEDFDEILHKAGNMVGLGDFRPRFGRFTATKVEVG
jgi:hypothetical protein